MNAISRWAALFVLAGLIACDDATEPTTALIVANEVESADDSGTGPGSTAEVELKLEGDLFGTANLPLASGGAKFEWRPDRRRFSAEVEDVGGATLPFTVHVGGTPFGAIAVLDIAGIGDLNLDERDGDVVPPIGDGVVTVTDAAGIMILSGELIEE